MRCSTPKAKVHTAVQRTIYRAKICTGHHPHPLHLAGWFFQFGSKFSKCIRFSDINYAIASKEDKTAIFLNHSELLNALDTGSTTKITINNKRLNRQNFEDTILLSPRGDFLDGYRAEYSTMLTGKVADSSNSVVQERYITASTHKKNADEARTFFDRVTNDITAFILVSTICKRPYPPFLLF